MPGVGNGPGGCPCGVVRQQSDPAIFYLRSPTPPEEREEGDLGVLRPDGYLAGIMRACRYCGTMYTLSADRDAELPK